jgi:hypothetical protein
MSATPYTILLPFDGDLSAMKLKWLFVGNPCGATTFTALFMSNAGLKCGHEIFDQNITERHWRSTKPDPETFEADCSYTLIEHCDNPPFDTLPLIGIIRDPYKVIQARMGNRFDHGQVIDPDEVIDEVIGRYVRILNHPRLMFEFKVEDGLHDVCDFLGLEWKPLDRNVVGSHNRGRLNLDRRSLVRYAQFQRLEAFASALGYKLT